MKHPVLCWPVLITGRRAVVRLPDKDVVVEAPAPVLREIFLLCDEGDYTTAGPRLLRATT
jgi:hypothetical protein